MLTIILTQRQNLLVSFLLTSLLSGLLVPLKAEGSITVSFFEGDYYNLIDQAKKQNKPYFINFITDWCSPCQSMNKFTYGNEELVSYVNQHYLALSVNAESESGQGQILADRYKVMFFPTVIIFTPQGEMLHKFTGYKNANDLLEELKKYGGKPTSQPIVQSPELRPYESRREIIDILPSRIITKNISAALAQNETAPKEAFFNTSTPTPESFSSQSTYHRKVSTNQPVFTPPTTRSDDKGTYELTLGPQKSQGFGVQTGVFADYGNMQREVARLKGKYGQEVLVGKKQLKGKTVYKVMVGPFPTYGHARKFTLDFERSERRGTIILNLNKK